MLNLFQHLLCFDKGHAPLLSESGFSRLKDWQDFFNNPYIRDLVNKDNDLRPDIAHMLQKNAKLFYSADEYKQLTINLLPHINELFFNLFFADDTVSTICKKMQTLLVEIYKNGSTQ